MQDRDGGVVKASVALLRERGNDSEYYCVPKVTE